ncbi:MAG: flagellar hook-length control protein FliK [Armatimonadota bacterium]|nr:flagellar hook-length control protein FliK [Armatimonadota bacterium]
MTPNAGNLLLEALGSAVPPDAGAQTPRNAESSDDRFAGLIRDLLAEVPDAETGAVRAGQQARAESKKQGEEHTCDNAQLASLLGSSGSVPQMLAQIATAGDISDLPLSIEETVPEASFPPVSAETPEQVETVTPDPVSVPRPIQGPVPRIGKGPGGVDLPPPTTEESWGGVAPVDAEATSTAEQPLPQAIEHPDPKTGQAPRRRQGSDAQPDVQPQTVQKEWNPRSAAFLLNPPVAGGVGRSGETVTPPVDQPPGAEKDPAWIALLRRPDIPKASAVDAADQEPAPVAREADPSGEPVHRTPTAAEGPAWMSLTRRPDWVNTPATNAHGQPAARATQVVDWLPDRTGGVIQSTGTAVVIDDDVQQAAPTDSGKRSDGNENQGRFESLLSDPGVTTTGKPENVASPAHLHPAREVGFRVINQIVRAAKTRLFDGGAEMTLRLDPPHLGSVRMSVTAAEGTVTAVLRTSTESARQLLQADIAVLKETLARSGINVDAIDVSVGAGPDQGWNLQGRHGEPGNGYGHANAPWGLPADDKHDDPETANAGGYPRHSGYGFDYLA